MFRLRETTPSPEYAGPRFSYSMISSRSPIEGLPLETILTQVYLKAGKSLPTFSRLLCRSSEADPLHLIHLRMWLNQLAWTAEGGATSVHPERSEAFYQVMTKNLGLAEREPEFNPNFFGEVKEGSGTCGDRVALSVLKMGIARDRLLAQARSLKEFWAVLKQAWAISLPIVLYNYFKRL